MEAELAFITFDEMMTHIEAIASSDLLVCALVTHLSSSRSASPSTSFSPMLPLPR